MITVQLTKRDIEEDPYRVWNEFVRLLATSSYEDLSIQQRPVHLVFWYESEVQNGGHLQYFENRGIKHLDETIEALSLLGAKCQQEVLRDASDLFLSRPRPRIQTAEEFSAVAMEGEFSALDARFGHCAPSLIECLEQYLSRNQSTFIAVR